MFAPEKIVAQHTHQDGTTTYLIVSSEMSYFTTSGRASMSVRTRYHVYANMVDGEVANGPLTKWHFKSKGEARKYFNAVKRGAAA